MPAADRSRWAHSRSRELDPWREHDACGVGFVARASGQRSAEIARLALQALARVAHRGAAATDRSGDGAGLLTQIPGPLDRKSTRLNSSHTVISYAVFCLKKKKIQTQRRVLNTQG